MAINELKSYLVVDQVKALKVNNIINEMLFSQVSSDLGHKSIVF